MKTIKNIFAVTSAAILAILLTAGSNSINGQSEGTEPLYSFLSNKGYRIYKIGPSSSIGLTESWKNEGAVAHVFKNPGPGRHAVYSYVKSDQYGVRYSYTKDTTSGVGGWSLQGIAFYLLSTAEPGTAPFYKLYSPVRETNPGQAFSGMVPGTDAVFLTLDGGKRQEALANGWISQGWLGRAYVTPRNAQSPKIDLLPDLVVGSTSVSGTTVTAVIENRGKHNVSSNPGIDVQLLILERNGSQVFSAIKSLGGMSPGQGREISFDTLNHNQAGRQFQIRVDNQNKIPESNDANNNSAPKPLLLMKIKSLPAGYIPPPSIALKGIAPASSGRTTYSITVTNRDRLNSQAFQSLTNILPSAQCGPSKTDARLIARLILVRDKPFPFGCKPINSAQDLASIDITVQAKLKDADRLKLSLEDRASGDRFESDTLTVGWFGVASILGPAGCKNFLGRASQYVCASDSGYKTCENLRLQGKPIQCRRPGEKF